MTRMSGLGISGTIVGAIGLRQTTNPANYALYLVGESKIAPVYSISSVIVNGVLTLLIGKLVICFFNSSCSSLRQVKLAGYGTSTAK